MLFRSVSQSRYPLDIQLAEAKALNVLNIALGIRAVNEGILESKIFRRELAEKAANITGKAYIATAKGISSVLGAIGIEAGVASVGVRALTSALGALGIPLLILGITALVDKFSEINTEAPKIKTAKEAYDDFNATSFFWPNSSSFNPCTISHFPPALS